MKPSEYWSNRFFNLGLLLVRDGAYPAAGIAAAQALLEEPASMLACLGTAAGILLFIAALAANCFCISYILSSWSPWSD
jgi:hypothetical protein